MCQHIFRHTWYCLVLAIPTSSSAISLPEEGKWDPGFSTPTVDQLLVIAHALGTTAADLLAGLTLTSEEPSAPDRAKAPSPDPRQQTRP